MAELPSGTITFLFSDIEGSTVLLKQLREAYGEVLADHQRLLRAAFEESGGTEIDTQGDAFFVAFARARDAVRAAVSGQRALAAHAWPHGARMRVRMGLHTGEPTLGAERYIGLGVHRAARICSAGHGGQVLLSNTTRELVEDDLPPDVALRELGEQRLKDLDRPERLFQLVIEDLPSEFPPLRTLDSAHPQATRLAARAGVPGFLLGQRRLGRRAGLALAVGLLVAGAGLVVGLLSLTGAWSSSAKALEGVPADSVAVIDPESNALLSGVSVDARPTRIAVGEGAVWVANFEARTVSRIDPSTRAVRTTIGSTGHPTGLATSKRALWVANGFEGLLLRIDPRTGHVVEPIDVGRGGGAVAAGEGAVWVANRLTDSLLRIDIETEERDQIRVGDEPGAVAVGAGSVWVANELDQSVTRLDAGGNGPAKTIALRFAPSGVAVGGGVVWVTNPLGDAVSRIDPRTNTVTATIPVGNGPIGVAADAGAVWVANSLDGTVSRIDPVSSSVVRTIRVGNSPEGVAVSSGAVWVAVHSQ